MMPVAIFSLVYGREDSRRKTEVALTIKFTKSFDALISLVVEKRIYI
ncbi:hypothetical protein J2X69_004237 [Algoriphagus sp. 4150]|nr:hypothetical protein [Algoriphagus sp. 4150]